MVNPEKVFKMGAVRASVFLNTFTNKEGRTVPLRKVVLEVRYKDKNGEWQGTNSLSLNDLPKAVTALQQAYEYLLSENNRVSQPDEAISEQPQPPVSASSAPSTYPRMIGAKRF